ncbi:TfuA-like protein [Nitratireductor sp. XY-223]|uniref:TfuA-like protein n=1 Tax=Nitratireductor sp. XY-223 TaxID=2561926 RepID=UPI0010AA3FF4|nr:TfuA-like protein [Nitratireductor sp. XY-223]
MIVVFAGPSLHGEPLERYDGMEFRPPVKQGDLFRASLDRPDAIGVIDGVFDGVPSVWHKEILWALTQGIPVFGAASMGALRAAELDAFGMTGIGRVYEAYRDGELEDDDEVALQHGPADAGYAPLTLAMVNIRATLDEALRTGRASADQCRSLAGVAKAIHFKARTWEALLQAIGNDCDTATRECGAWMRKNHFDQKKRDALALLQCLEDKGSWPDRPVGFHFEHTELWRRGVEEWRARRDPSERARDGSRRPVEPERLFRIVGGDE